MSHGTYEFALTLPLTHSDRQTAHTFANQQPTAAKAEQVWLNTLAVLAVQNYLQLMDIPTNSTVGDSWNAVMRLCTDVADLELPGMGRLECRPVKPGATVCAVPAETWEDRVGYVAVQVDEAAQAATLLGFIPQVEDEEVALSQLEAPEALIDHLATLNPVPQPEPVHPITHLSQWLQGAIEEGWQAVDDLLSSLQLSPQLQPAYAFRRRANAVRQGRRVMLGNDEPDVALIVGIRPAIEQVEIFLQLHPLVDQSNLPSGLQLSVMDADGNVAIDTSAIGTEDFLELQIDGDFGEQFSVQITYNEVSTIQAFII